jgi:hypothetical protein
MNSLGERYAWNYIFKIGMFIEIATSTSFRVVLQNLRKVRFGALK